MFERGRRRWGRSGRLQGGTNPVESNEEEEEAAGVRMSRLPRREGSAQVDEPRRGAGRSCIRRTRRAPSDTGPLSDVDEASPERSRRGTATAAAPPTGRRALAAAIFGGVYRGREWRWRSVGGSGVSRIFGILGGGDKSARIANQTIWVND